jgi:hypothetical protein
LSKLNICALSKDKVYSPFFCAEYTVTVMTYLDMLDLWLWPYLKDFPVHLYFQQDGILPHYDLKTRKFLDEQLPRSWTGCGGPIPWPQRPSNLSPHDFLWTFIKDYIYTPPMP